MSSLSNLFGDKTWVLPLADGFDGTLTIGWTFVFLAYFLHPVIEWAFHRLRAYRAWRCIQKRQAVEVTSYNLMAEVFGGRGSWDSARNIAVILAVFSLTSWGLELSMDLASLEGEADLLNRPPPVFLRPETNDTNTDPWQASFVLTLSDIDPDYNGNWRGLEHLNVEDTHANSRYYIVKDTREYLGKTAKDTFINGEILVASWDDKPSLFYDTNGANVDSLECSGETLKDAEVYLGTNLWGNALDCERGPRPTNSTTSPPAVVLTNGESGRVSVIVEESSSYPTFLYSVWTAEGSDSVELAYLFHVHSTVRLVEAVITGIVHGETEGGACFGLLRVFSETRVEYEDGLDRASPFGEIPTGDTVLVQDLETIEAGVEINMNALVCLLWVMASTAVCVVWLICLRNSIGMDVYDRDELLRAVSLQGHASRDPAAEHPAIRIFVRREDSGNITVFINDSHDKEQRAWERFLRRRTSKVVEGDDRLPAGGDADAALSDDKFGGATVPVKNTVSLGGFQADHNTHDVSSAGTPARSGIRSLAVTPVRDTIRRNPRPNPFEGMDSPASGSDGGR
ncbi:unnamed protein product [Ectocarpus sp. 6 AP-2014]